MTKTKQAEPALFEQPVTEEPKKRGAVAKMAISPEPANMLSIIASAAANPNVDVSKMRELLTMQREIVAEEARIAFTEDFIRMTLPTINRDGKIEIEGKGGKRGGAMRYATFENINKVVEPILKQHGFAMWFEPDIGPEGRIIMRGHLDHARGHGKACAISLPLETSGAKNNVQGVGSSISYGKRYAAIALLNIVSHAPDDRDTDGEAPKENETITGPQSKKLLEAIDASGISIGRFMEKYEITAAHQLPASKFAEALKALEDYAEEAKRRAAEAA